MARVARRIVDNELTTLATPPALLAAVESGAKAAGSTGASSGPGKGDAWKSQAWDYYDQVGELQFVCQWLQNALSRSRIIASDVNAAGNPTGTTEDVQAAELASDIAGGPAGQAEMLGRLATALTIPGEGYVAIIHRPDPAAPTSSVDPLDPLATPIGPVVVVEEWHVLSTDEVKRASGGSVELTLADGTKHEMDDDVDTITRVWRPHPRRAHESTSAIRSALPILREIVRIGQIIEATAKSRLAGAGLLLLPSEISLPTAAAPTAMVDPDAPGLPIPTVAPAPTASANDVMTALVNTASVAIADPSAAASLVPVVMQAPGDQIGNVKLISFATELTATMLALREAAVKRFALTVDVPSEVLLGVGDTNHWSAWQIEESAIKLHVEPLLTVIVQALTEGVYRPMLSAQGHPDPESVTLWFDTTMLALRPNRAADAKEAFTQGAISAAAYRKALGFAETDAPIEVVGTDGQPDAGAEQRNLAMTLVAAAPTLLPLLASTLGLTLDTPPNGMAPATAPAAPPPAVDPAPIPEQPTGPDDGARVAVASTVAQLCLDRAVTLAGNRRRTRAQTKALADVPSAELHLQLEPLSTDAAGILVQGWDRELSHQVLAMASCDRGKLVAAVTEAAVHTLTQRRPTSAVQWRAEHVRRWLR